MINSVFEHTRCILSGFLLNLILTSTLCAGATGIFSGKVYNNSNNTPLPGATISLEDTDISGKTDKHGYYTLAGIPPGIYTAQIQHFGYTTILCKQLIIQADINTTIDFGMQLQYTSNSKYIEVQAQQLTHRGSIATTHYVTTNILNQSIPTDNVLDSFKYIPGIFRTHFRGGERADVIYLLDGMPMISGYARELAFNIPISAIEDVVVSTGGVSSEYANSTAGVVNIIRKRGRKQFSAKARTYTDYIGNSTKYRDNYRRFEASLGGPMAINFGGPELNMNYFLSFDFNANDTPQKGEIKKIYDEGAVFHNLNISSLFDFSLSKNNNLAFQGALSRWTNHQLRDDYFPEEFAFSKEENKHLRGALNYTYTPNRSLIFHLNFSAQKISDNMHDTQLNFAIENEDEITAVVNQEGVLWDFQVNENSYRLQGGFSKQFNKFINLKAGFSADFFNLELTSNKLFYFQNADTIDQFSPIQSHYYRSPNAFGSYVEAGFESHHLVAKLGARIDNFNPNTAVVKQSQGEISTLSNLSFTDYVFSPRLFIGIPFNDTHQLFFNMGEYAQLPAFAYLYHGIGASSEVISAQYPLFGNPDLRMQTSRNMELVFQRKVARNFSASFTLFQRQGKHNLSTGFNPVFDSDKSTLRYMSSAESSAEGFEVAFSKAIAANLDIATHFTHQTIKGETNFPEENYFYFLNTGQLRDTVPHKLNRSQDNIFALSGTYKWRDNLHFSFISRFESPRDLTWESSVLPVKKEQIEWRNYTDFKIGFQVWAKRYQIGPYVEVRNLLNSKHNEFEKPTFLFGKPMIAPFQSRYGRRIRIGVQIF